MGVIEVQAPGLLTTVQDLGREGYGPMGVSPSGAADPVSLRIGNRLAGNAAGSAALEMTLLGGRFAFSEDTVIALAGSDFGAAVDGTPVPLWTPTRVMARAVLHVGPTREGARCYLCVQGGMVVKDFLGSASTHVLSGLGGHQGRALRAGDVLQIGAKRKDFREGKLHPKVLAWLAPRKVLRVTPGPQYHWFSSTEQRKFFESAFQVTEEANRMGIRLEGAAIQSEFAGEMISEGVSLGAVQITAGGAPIVLFVEQQTTGGYPKIANVISADLHRLGQLRPRNEVRFELVEMDAARQLLMKQEELLTSGNLIV